MEPDNEAIVCDNSMRFSERTFIRVITRIIRIGIASNLPTIERKSEVWIHPLITDRYVNRREQWRSMK
jgi:hypothetical protein